MLALDFIGELGDHLAVACVAIVAAARAERVDLIELALRLARSIVVETIGEFRAISGIPSTSESLRASPAFQAVARE